MKYYIGISQNNHAVTSNRRLLAWFQQYQYFDNKLTPVDILNQIFYPNYDLSNSILGDEGSFVLAHDRGEKFWYDPYGIVKQVLGQVGEIVSIDKTRYIQGTGIYEVISHKGNTAIKTKTWCPWNSNVLVRSIQARTVKGNASEADIFPVVHLKSTAQRIENIFLSRISDDQWLAVTATPSSFGIAGPLEASVLGGKSTIFEHSSLPTFVTFSSKQTLPASGYSEPVYLIFAMGSSREEALKQLKWAESNINNLYADSLNEWREWLKKGIPAPALTPGLQYFWNVSCSLLRMSMQLDGSPIITGFRPYQGNVWIRDGIWMITTLAYLRHFSEATAGLYRILNLLKVRSDGAYYAAYNVTTGFPNEHALENDTMGLLLYCIWNIWSLTQNQQILSDSWDVAEYCTDWIMKNIDETGLVREDAGIWETFGPHLNEPFEHMTWTSAISSYGISKAAIMAQSLGHAEKTRLYDETSKKLIDSIATNNVKNNVVYRSLEKKLMDSSVLLFFTEFDLFPREWLKPTIQQVIKRLEDPFLGGIWRHESLVTEEGDMRPWTGPTFWLGEALLADLNPPLAWHYFNHNYENSSYCGLLPELLYSKGLPRGIAMPSYSQSGVIRSILYGSGKLYPL